MKANVTLITLTVADIGKATRFYENLGFVKSKESQEEVSFFHAGGIVLSLWTPGRLFDFGSWPGAFFAPEPKYRVIGNVLALHAGPRLLRDLDKYEGVAPAEEQEREWPEAAGLFHRITVRVALDKGGSVEAFTYALKEMPRARLIGTGDFIADRALRTPSAVRR